MYNFDSTEPTGGKLAAQILIWGGVLLLIVGGFLTFPYISSRMTTFPSTSTPAPSPSPSLVPSPTVTYIIPTNPPTLAPAFTSTPIPTPTPTQPPTPTPAPPAPAPPTRIIISSIDVDAPVSPVSWQTIEVDGKDQAAWEVLDMYAAGWHESSAPLGMPGNTVLNGHNTTYGEVFRDLYTLNAGDEIVVYADDKPHTFAVTEVLILPEAGQPLDVRIENARYILPTDDERLTLVTCHPYGSLQNRLIVIAHSNSE
ncbi:MAG: sortase [Chloroflexi bacterium]|nr:sortase [Chloroflexota bacterium]